MDPLLSHHNTQHLPLGQRVVEPIVYSLLQLLLRFIPSLLSEDQVDPRVSMDLQVLL